MKMKSIHAVAIFVTYLYSSDSFGGIGLAISQMESC